MLVIFLSNNLNDAKIKLINSLHNVSYYYYNSDLQNTKMYKFYTKKYIMEKLLSNKYSIYTMIIPYEYGYKILMDRHNYFDESDIPVKWVLFGNKKTPPKDITKLITQCNNDKYSHKIQYITLEKDETEYDAIIKNIGINKKVKIDKIMGAADSICGNSIESINKQLNKLVFTNIEVSYSSILSISYNGLYVCKIDDGYVKLDKIIDRQYILNRKVVTTKFVVQRDAAEITNLCKTAPHHIDEDTISLPILKKSDGTSVTTLIVIPAQYTDELLYKLII